MSLRKITNSYTVTPNHILNNKDLSFKAKGLWAYINSKPEGWDFSVDRIALATKEGVKSVRSGLAELREAGLLSHQPKINPETKLFEGQEYFLFDTDQRLLDSAALENRGIQNGGYISNKEYSKKEVSNKEEGHSQKGQERGDITNENFELETKVKTLIESKLPQLIDFPLLYSIVKSVIEANKSDYEGYIKFVARNKTGENLFKPIAWRSWFYQDYLAWKATIKPEVEPEWKKLGWPTHYAWVSNSDIMTLEEFLNLPENKN